MEKNENQMNIEQPKINVPYLGIPLVKFDEILSYGRLGCRAELGHQYIENEREAEIIREELKFQYPDIPDNVINQVLIALKAPDEFIEKLKNSKAHYYGVDGEVKIIRPMNERCFTGEEIHNYLGGYFEAIPIHDKNQELKYWIFVLESPGVRINELASGRFGSFLMERRIFGNCLVIDKELVS